MEVSVFSVRRLTFPCIFGLFITASAFAVVPSPGTVVPGGTVSPQSDVRVSYSLGLSGAVCPDADEYNQLEPCDEPLVGGSMRCTFNVTVRIPATGFTTVSNDVINDPGNQNETDADCERIVEEWKASLGTAPLHYSYTMVDDETDDRSLRLDSKTNSCYEIVPTTSELNIEKIGDMDGGVPSGIQKSSRVNVDCPCGVFPHYVGSCTHAF